MLFYQVKGNQLGAKHLKFLANLISLSLFFELISQPKYFTSV